MRRPILAVALALLLAVSALSLGGGTRAEAAPAAPAALAAAPHIAFHLEKTVLTDTSIDGPAMWSGFRSGISNFGEFHVLAWTGTDANHHLNVMTSTDGIHFHNKRTLNETSFVRPAVTLFGEGQGVVVLAWTGTDPNHSLNILYDVYGAHPQKVTLRDENSLTAPALGEAGGIPQRAS